jgi:biopolymer transport protein ExbD
MNIIVSVGADDAVSIGTDTIAQGDLDSLLYHKIDSLDPLETQPFVVIHADSASSYGVVYRIMQISKRAGARVTTNIKARD